jgi:hypothetical protein
MFLLPRLFMLFSHSRRPYTRIYRNGPPSPAAKVRARRSLSSDSYGLTEKKETKELSAGQKKAAEDKKGSRHADVIDTWDPTGLGSASGSSLLPFSFRSRRLIGSVASFRTI